MIAIGQPIHTFEVLLGEDDYFEYTLCHQYSVPEVRRQAVVQKTLSALFYAALSAYGAFVVTDWLLAVMPLVMVLLVLTGYRASTVKAIRKNIARMKATGKLPFESPMILSFTDRELVCEAKENTDITQFSAIERIVAGPNALYLYKNAISAYILPKRAIRGLSWEDFLPWILEKTNAKLLPGRIR